MLRNLFCILVTAVSTILFFPVAVLAIIVTLDPGKSVWVARRLWSPILIWAGGARVVVSGQENVDPNRPTIYVSNHQSSLDIPVGFVAVPVNFRYHASTRRSGSTAGATGSRSRGRRASGSSSR